MATADAAFLRAIVESPEEEGPRLVFADWLDEHGDHDRAEFIRVECEQERVEPYGPRWRQLTARQRDLLKAHKAEWTRPLRGLAAHTRFRRGFIEEITVHARTFLTRADDLFRLAPVRVVKFVYLPTGRGVSVEEVAAGPHLARLTGLDFSGCFLSDAQVQTLATSPHLGALTELTLESCRVGRPGLQALLESPALDRLTALNLSFSLADDSVAELLAGAGRWRLTRLGLAAHLHLGVTPAPRVTGRGVRALAAAPALADLTGLALTGQTAVGPDGVRAVVTSPHLGRMTDLRLTGCGVGDPEVQAIAASPNFARLNRLELGRRLPRAERVGDAGVQALAESPHLAALRYLDLEGNDVTDAGAEAVAASPHLAGLGFLNLKANPVGAAGQRSLRKRFGAGVCTFSRA
jgi:uncharacterized protein (TIGR02996 family)